MRADRTTDAELKYLRAMAELGPDPHLAGDVAAVLGRKSTSLGPTRARLIDKGVLWTPSHGYAAFTVPQFDRYMKRTYQLGISREPEPAQPGTNRGPSSRSQPASAGAGIGRPR